MISIAEYQSIHENKSHFEAKMPYNTYPCTIPLDFGMVPLHWHDDAEFIYIKKGRCTIAINMQEYELTAGEIAFIIPGSVHGIYQYRNETVEYENIIFDSRMLSSGQDETYEKFLKPLFDNEVELPLIFKQGVVGYESVQRYLDKNDGISSNRTGAWGLAIKGNLSLLFFDLVSLYEKKTDLEKMRKIDKLKPVIKYVELHYGDRITVEEMASLTGFSESHFMRFFKDTLGVSFVTYLNDYRLSMAARMMLQSEETILSISQQAGFDNLSHFNRCFKKKYNKTPREFRNS